MFYSYALDPAGDRLSQTDATGTTYPFRSAAGDLIALANGATGNLDRTYAYSPFGELESTFSSQGSPFLYGDDYLDPATSLYNQGTGWYDPTSGTSLGASAASFAAPAASPAPAGYASADAVYDGQLGALRLSQAPGIDPGFVLGPPSPLLYPSSVQVCLVSIAVLAPYMVLWKAIEKIYTKTTVEHQFDFTLCGYIMVAALTDLIVGAILYGAVNDIGSIAGWAAASVMLSIIAAFPTYCFPP